MASNLEHSRSQIVYVTILEQIVFEYPHVDPDYLANFQVSPHRYDYNYVLRQLERGQADRLTAIEARLTKLGLTLPLAADWIGLTDRDRRSYSHNNFVGVEARFAEWNDVLGEARRYFAGQRKRPDLETEEMVSYRDEERREAHLWQLRKAKSLTTADIRYLSAGFQCIYRDFSDITLTKYAHRLKLASSTRKVKKCLRKKLYRLPKELPNVSAIGMIELELIDLHHITGGEHEHRVKSRTVRLLASQKRTSSKHRGTDEALSLEAQQRRFARETRLRLLDEDRARIASNESLPEDPLRRTQYAVLVHAHLLVDLNGTPRADFEKWLTGRGDSTRKFKGFWTLPYQVMVKSLFEEKSVEENLRHISFYPFKGPLAFNYENTAPRQEGGLCRGDTTGFSDEALVLIAWLQHAIGHESLRIAINWPGSDQEKRGRKPAKPVIPTMMEDRSREAAGPVPDANGLSQSMNDGSQIDPYGSSKKDTDEA